MQPSYNDHASPRSMPDDKGARIENYFLVSLAAQSNPLLEEREPCWRFDSFTFSSMRVGTAGLAN